MRSVLPALLLLAMIAGACRQVSPAPVPREPAPPRESPPDPAALARRLRAGDAEAEARLAALGPDARPWLEPLVEDGDPEVRMRARSVLLSADGDTDDTGRKRLEVLIHDLARPAPPFVALRAIGRLRSLGAAGREALETAAAGTGPDAEAARRLLRRWAP